MRLPGRPVHPGRRQPPQLCLCRVRDHPLRKPENGARLDSVWERDGELKLLLCKRAIEPRRGYWTLPAGFMENNETTAEAAMRETVEEAGAHIELGKLFTLLNVARVHQVHMFYLATLIDLDFAPGEESLDVQMFSEADIPWDDLAFPTTRTTLELFFADRVRMRESGGQADYGFHTLDINRPMRSDL